MLIGYRQKNSLMALLATLVVLASAIRQDGQPTNSADHTRRATPRIMLVVFMREKRYKKTCISLYISTVISKPEICMPIPVADPTIYKRQIIR